MTANPSRSVLVVASGETGNAIFGTAFVVRTTKTYDTVITCAHVVREVSPAILIDGQEAHIVAMGESDGIDLAVLRIKSSGHRIALPLTHHPMSGDNCTIVAFDELAKSARLIERNGTIGESHSLAQRRTGRSATAWEIVSLERKLVPGNSGAPVMDPQTGHVVGVVNYRLGQNTGLAIASENLRLIWREAPLQTAAASVSLDTTALHIDLNAWLAPLRRLRLTADRLLLEETPHAEDAFFIRFEQVLDDAHAEQLRIVATAGPREPAMLVANGRAFRTLLLAALIRSSESAAKWALAQTVGVLINRKEIRDESVLLSVWKTVCDEPHGDEEVERILRVLFDEMREDSYKKHERLYVFITFLLDRVIRAEPGVRKIADTLREHDDALGNDAPPSYLERLKRLYGQAVARAEAEQSGPRTFAPDVALISPYKSLFIRVRGNGASDNGRGASTAQWPKYLLARQRCLMCSTFKVRKERCSTFSRPKLRPSSTFVMTSIPRNSMYGTFRLSVSGLPSQDVSSIRTHGVTHLPIRIMRTSLLPGTHVSSLSARFLKVPRPTRRSTAAETFTKS